MLLLSELGVCACQGTLSRSHTDLAVPRLRCGAGTAEQWPSGHWAYGLQGPARQRQSATVERHYSASTMTGGNNDQWRKPYGHMRMIAIEDWSEDSSGCMYVTRHGTMALYSI